MAHYAKVLEGKVVDVIVAESSYFDTFVDTTPGDWIQTSYKRGCRIWSRERLRGCVHQY